MLAPYSQSKFVEKILANAKGEEFRVIFLVSLEGGEIKARIVSAEKIDARKEEALSLPGSPGVCPQEISYIPFFSCAFSSFDELFFFNSQPTRAPSLY